MPRALATRLKNALPARTAFAIAFLLVVFCVSFGLAPSVLQVSGSKASAAGGAKQSTRTLSVEERVRYQRAVEEVYWRHTIWPKENAGTKPGFAEVASLDVTRGRVEDALRKSDALARQWKSPVTAGQLQAEVARMARETRQPEVLRELWQALDNDPLVVAEVLARPALVERLARNYYSSDDSFHGALREKAVAQLRKRTTLDSLRRRGAAGGSFSQIEAVKVARKSPRAAASGDAALTADAKDVVLELTTEEWETETARIKEMFGAESCDACGGGSVSASSPVGSVSNVQEDERSFYVTSVVANTGKRLKVARFEWSKTSFDSWWSGARAGFKADASTEGFDYKLTEINQLAAAGDDKWTPTKALPEATGTVVWTGTEMIIWGGGKQNSGARYNPATDTWTPTSTTGVPTHRGGHTAVWTGTEMIVWGGCERHFDFCGTNDGDRYNPVSDTWTGMSITNAPTPRSQHVAVWTGSRMIVWAGIRHEYNNQGRAISSGGIYDPTSDSWTTMNSTGAPGSGSRFTAVWTGTEMIAWGGNGSVGGRYNSNTDTWTPTNSLNAPSPRTYHTAVWTGTEMIVWGGNSGNGLLNDGRRYNPANDTWTPTSTTSAPSPRAMHTAVWTGTEMIVWGGNTPELNDPLRYNDTNTGGRYNPSTDSWTPTSTANAPPPKSLHVAVWTGELMIVWSVTQNKTGGRYNPTNNFWTPTDNNDSPPPITFGVWSGTEMIVWYPTGYCWTGVCPSLSRRYNPATYSWQPMSDMSAPIPPPSDRPIAAVWTGTEMVVWGSDSGASNSPGQGGRYNPQTDSWRPITTSGAPVNRSYFTGVWSGTELIVWGGQSNEGTLQNTGGRYNPSTDTWRPTNTVGAPEARYLHTAVWTGAEMIIWGGSGGSLSHLNTGGRYNPANDTWTPTNTSGAPEGRRFHTAIWTGAEMIVWGGRIGDYNDSAGLFNTGGRYNPANDIWTPTSTTGALAPRFKHTAVWTGELMIVWGGLSPNALGSAVGSNTGGNYRPETDAWTPTSTLSAPGRRHEHIAFWTGTGMLVWGGYADDGSASHGGYYFPPGSANGNTPPAVRITAPADNATFAAGATVEITTETSDSDGTISSVEFYANDTSIGSDTTAPFGLSWSGMSGGNYTIKAVATDDGGGVTTSATVSLRVIVPANLSLSVVDSPDPIAVGNNLTYTLTAANGGQGDATNTVVTATLPANATFVSATDGCTLNVNTLTCALGALANGANRQLSIIVTPTVAGTLSFAASVASDTGDPDTSNNAAQAATDVHLRGTDVIPGNVLISEFRAHGNATVDPNLDDFVELYNNTDAAITVGPADASGGWALVAREADGLPAVVRATIPKGTVIPARGHYLITAPAYSLGALAASNLPVAGNILDTGGLALFRTADPAKFNQTGERLDAVGFSSVSDGMYREGAGLTPIDAVQAEQSFVRKLGSGGHPQDTGDNASDFQLISKSGAAFGAVQSLLGAPGPENMASPLQRNATIKPSLVDPQCPGFGATTSACARVRTAEGAHPTNAAYGTLLIRRRFTNKTNARATALRFRITDITTLGTPDSSSLADLRALDSAEVEVTATSGGAVILRSTLLESAQALGGGINSALVLPLAGNGLAPNAAVDVQFRLGVQRNGAFRFFVNVEAATAAVFTESKSEDGKQQSLGK